jgi:hypothetical protein
MKTVRRRFLPKAQGRNAGAEGDGRVGRQTTDTPLGGIISRDVFGDVVGAGRKLHRTDRVGEEGGRGAYCRVSIQDGCGRERVPAAVVKPHLATCGGHVEGVQRGDADRGCRRKGPADREIIADRRRVSRSELQCQYARPRRRRTAEPRPPASKSHISCCLWSYISPY